MLGILYPTSLANLVVEVGTRHRKYENKKMFFFYLTDQVDLEMIQHFSVCSHPKYKWSDCTKFCTRHNQCGTKPNLIAKILATKFGGFFCHICIMFSTRQIWGIWKLWPAYSPETPNLGQNQWCFVLCDLEIWWMTLENNKAPLLCCSKLCATFHSHRWIQTGVAVRKRPIWVKFDDS